MSQALKDGDALMNVGKLKNALPYYEKVMDKMMFQVILLVTLLELIHILEVNIDPSKIFENVYSIDRYPSFSSS